MRLTTLQHIDNVVFQYLFNKAKHRDFRPIVWVSRSGDGACYLLIAALLWWLDPVHGKLFSYVGLLAYALELPLFIVLKRLFKRPRPADLFGNFHAHIQPADKFSLPSGHTAAAFLMAVIVAYFYPSMAFLAYSWACLIGLSRILLGVHYPGDIIAGAALGTTIGLFSLFIMV